MARHFQVKQGRTVTLPQGLQAGAGATNMRLDPGDVCTLEDHHGEFERFIANRTSQGDWDQVDAPPPDAGRGRTVPSPNRVSDDSAQFGIPSITGKKGS